MSDSDSDSRSEVSSSEGEEEEEEVSDYSDRGHNASTGKKRARDTAGKKGGKRQKTSKLFEEEASEDDDDDDAIGARYVEDEDEDDDVAEERKLISARLEARMKSRDNFLGKSEADVVAAIEERHKIEQDRVNRSVREDGSIALVQNAFLPTLSDPKLFCIKCKPGEERMLCLQLITKYRHLTETGKEPKIYSALAPGTKGFVYVEARTQQHVSDALFGIRGIFRTNITLVPLAQMPAVLRIQSQKQVLKVGDYVRLRRAPYKGDLARIHVVLEAEGRFVLKYVPRVDTKAFGLPVDERKELAKKKIVVAQRFFNAQEVENAGGMCERRRPDWYDRTLDFYDNEYFENGYVLKSLLERNFQTKNVKPTLEELQAFRHGSSGGDDEDDQEGALEDGNVLDDLGNAALPQSAEGRKGQGGPVFKRGDVVLVREGELQNMKGEVTAILINGTVMVNPLDESVRGNLLEFSPADLMKLFDVGDHVKILNGSYAGETGSVVKIIEDDHKWKAIVFTDSGGKEVMAFLDDLQVSAEVAQARDSLKGYNLFDLVSLGTQVGVIVKVGSESMDVLQQTGLVRTVHPGEIRAKLNNKSKTTNAMDGNRNPISVGTIVKVISGEGEGLNGIEGTIKHIHRSFLFIQSRMRVQHAGICVVRARSVVQAGIKLRNAGGFGQAARGVATSTSMAGGRGHGGGFGGGDEDSVVGKTVKVKGGRHKGYIGIVVSAIETTCKVEIHSKKKMVELPRDLCIIVGDKNGRVQGGMGASGAGGMGAYGGQMPGYNGVAGQYGHGTYNGAPHGDQGGFAPATPTNAPHTPSAATEGEGAWNPNLGGSTTPRPNTPGADDGGTWGSSAAASPAAGFVPPTPAFDDGSGYASQTPAAHVPQTPATPAVPQTPAALYGSDKHSDGMESGTRVRVTSGALVGSMGVLQGIDGDDAIVMLDGQPRVKILRKSTVAKA